MSLPEKIRRVMAGGNMPARIDDRRDISLDYLKCLALLGLVIAHITTSDLLFQIRVFDVNLLVIISAMLGAKSFERGTRNLEQKEKIRFVGKYYVHRFCRLVLPTWIFITIYLLLNKIFFFSDLSREQIIRTYLLQDRSLGYVWIIYIYLICAFMMPLLRLVDWRKKIHVLVSIAVFMIYLYLAEKTDDYNFRIFILYPMIYGLISAIGVNFERICLRFWNVFGIALLGVFACMAIRLWQLNGEFVVTGGLYKYPPKLYYLTYTIGVAVLLLVLASVWKKHRKGCFMDKFIIYVSRSSLWLYLWHILGIQIAKRITGNEYLEMVLVVAVSLFITSIQNVLVNAIERKTGRNWVLDVFKG